MLACAVDGEGREAFRCDASDWVVARLERYFENIASPASIVGSSRFAGVAVFDLDLLIDFPNAPVSGACFLALDPPRWPLGLPRSAEFQ